MAVPGETIEVDHGYKKLIQEITKSVKGNHVDVGIFGGENPSGESILTYAMANEFGTAIRNPRSGGETIIIPARPFLRHTVDTNRGKYNKMIDDGLSRIADGRDTGKGVLTRLGLRIKNDIVRNIKSGPWEPNAPSTRERKGSSRPLIDLGAMWKAVTFKLGKQ